MYTYNTQSIQYHTQKRIIAGWNIETIRKELYDFVYNAPRKVIDEIIRIEQEQSKFYLKK